MAIADTASRPDVERLAEPPSAARLQHLIVGAWISQAIAVAAELGIADLLAAGPRASDALAQASGAHPAALYRLLRALAGVGVFTEVEPRVFALSPMADLLRADAPGSLRDSVLFFCSDVHWRTWGQLDHSVRTGLSAFDHLFGMSPWQYRSLHPENGLRFDAAMTSIVAHVARAVVDAYDFSGVRTVVDVGGSHGGLLFAILRSDPHLNGIVFDLPHVSAGADERIARSGLQARCRAVAGDMFSHVPEGGDAYLLSRVIHDWDDERAVAILESCRRAMAPDSRLLVVEEVITPGDGLSSYGKLSDLNMLVSPGGQERTEDEYRALYAAAGFAVRRVIPTRSRVSIMEALQ
jgi:hypothetical protein